MAEQEPRDPNTIKVGDHIMYVLELGRSRGESRPAFVVRKWGDGDMVNLQVLTDANNEIDPLDKQSYSLGNGMLWATSVHYSKEHTPRTWHWLGE